MAQTLPRHTREHVVAELSVLSFRYLACRAGHVTDVPGEDYGYDLMLFTHSPSGERETGMVLLQFKATDRPVMLVVFDAATETGYWLHIQPYLRQHSVKADRIAGTLNVRLPKANVVTEQSVGEIRKLKQSLMERFAKANL